MISEATIQASDMHGIWCLDNLELINTRGFDVTIGDHVWLGRNSSIVRPLKIGEGSIVGFGSIVTKDIPPLSVACGNPAKVIRSNCTWTREFDKNQLQQCLNSLL